ncbi:MAG: ATP-dependent RecD-like DNA helicase [Anaerolineae bacterium]|nr:ATP-dependent RecD-like DNA helicase [Anaerolineae bacterium]
MQTLKGIIERITFHSEEDGYTVAQLTPEGKEYTVPVVGNMLGINVGESVELSGEWTTHPQYGRQFRVESFRTVLPATIAGIRKYLGSGLIKGIGPVTAQRIVRRFGLDTLRIIEEEPQRLKEVLGVGPKRAAMIERAWAEQRQIKEVMLFLQAHDVSTALAVKIYKQYGDAAISVVKNDPYRLARDVYGIGFLTADKIARKLGIPADAPERVAAGVSYVLSQKADEGHVYVPQRELVRESAKILDVPPELVEQGIEMLRADERVHVEEGLRVAEGRSQVAGRIQVAEERPVYLVPFYYGEIGVAGRLKRLIEASEERLFAFQQFDWPQGFAAVQQKTRLRLTPEQQEAVRTALTQRVTVLTGGPGTGKTTCLQTVIRLLEAAGRRYALAAPTGRAAKRLSEATGRPARTVHRLLEVTGGGGFQFGRNEENPLEVDMVVVDEASMLDLLLTNHLLKAIPPGAHLLLVGDVDQLPSVGAGDVLRDVIESGAAAVVRLTTIFRQPEHSYIVRNAHRINQGQLPLFAKEASDFFLFKTDDPEQAAELVVELVQTRIPRRFGFRPDEIQVLSPMYRGAAGVSNLNRRLQETLNPPAEHKPERRVGGSVFRLGDRVMQVRNNYDKEVYNGDLGRIVRLDPIEQRVVVDMEGRRVEYDFLEPDELVHAFAISIHKSQGSEYRAVVITLLPTHYVMLQRNLLYTAVTRAQELVVIVGNMRAIAMAVGNDKVAERHSALAERLRPGW